MRTCLLGVSSLSEQSSVLIFQGPAAAAGTATWPAAAARRASASAAAVTLSTCVFTITKKVSIANTGPFAIFATFVFRRGRGHCVGTSGSIGDDRWCRHHGAFLDASALVRGLGLRFNMLGDQREHLLPVCHLFGNVFVEMWVLVLVVFVSGKSLRVLSAMRLSSAQKAIGISK